MVAVAQWRAGDIGKAGVNGVDRKTLIALAVALKFLTQLLDRLRNGRIRLKILSVVLCLFDLAQALAAGPWPETGELRGNVAHCRQLFQRRVNPAIEGNEN